MSLLSALNNRYQVQSEPLLTERRIELAVLALVALLLVQVLWNVLDLAIEPAPEAVLPTRESLQVGGLSGRQLVNAERSAELRSRPLFFASRRPEVPVAAAAKAPEPKKNQSSAPKLKLVGVFGASGSRGIIAVHKGKLLRLKIGDEVSGWTLQKVDRDRALLNSGAESFSVALQRTDTGITPEAVPEPADKSRRSNNAPNDEKDKAAKPGGLSLGG